MQRIKKRQAFSLIELSIVILVVGILVAGVMQASSMMIKFQLQTARSLTNSSPVSSIKDLALWLETTSESSFSGSYPDNLDRIGTWRDINSQVGIRNDATQTTGSLQPYFYENVINGLPGMYFTPSTNQIMNGTSPINSKNSNGSFSFFLVALSNQTGNFQTPFDTGTWNSQGWAFNKLQSAWNNELRFLICRSAGCAAPGTATYAPDNVIQIYSAVFDDNSKLWYYINGGTQTFTQTGLGTILTATSGYRVGNDQGWINATVNAAWRGYIGEIIVYNRALKTEERRAVEKYLGQKWKIAVVET
ncbi:MAG: type II secretion system GspH family protein [Rickettsiales bacterium]|nr:type II secretion system GspH family protein [Rickettsiales bacterium]